VTKASLVLATDEIRHKAAHWCLHLPRLTRVTFQEPKRTLPQNKKMWAMLGDIATSQRAALKAGNASARDLPPEAWKCLVLHALGKEARYEPSLDGEEIVPLGYSSSELGISEMADMIAFMDSWGAENNVTFTDPNQ